MAEELYVYLDHLIRRESLRYKRSEQKMRYEEQPDPQFLRLDDLRPDRAWPKNLRKPDFQRATSAWTPEDCVSLLESLTSGHVIPSVILWSSENNTYKYVLDGGHRISVILAWIRDDWGESVPPDDVDEDQAVRIKAAAREVHNLVKVRVGDFREYEEAHAEWVRLEEEGKDARAIMKGAYKRAIFANKLGLGNIAFHILWAQGNYEQAERSFIRINNSGRQLSDWEKTLLNNRNSSFARIVMSVANPSTAKYYWPNADDPQSGAEDLQPKVDEILTGINNINEILFQPPYKTPITTIQLPLLHVPAAQQQMKPAYLAELLTVIEGKRGQETETAELMARDNTVSGPDIIRNGAPRIKDISDALSHLAGTSSRSLAVITPLYFYNRGGRHVRSLLYGFLFWLMRGALEEINLRKQLFSAHRSAFEVVLLRGKDEFITGLSRRSGSGPEVTGQTAQYFNGILDLLMNHQNAIDTPAFAAEHKALLERFRAKREQGAAEAEGTSRTFSDRQRSATYLQDWFQHPGRCGICDGMLDTSRAVQHDHILPFSKGGKTLVGNERMVHPFCNNNREVIEKLRANQLHRNLPVFGDPDEDVKNYQMAFVDLAGFM